MRCVHQLFMADIQFLSENLRTEGREGRSEGRLGVGNNKEKNVISHGQATAESICEPGKRS